MPLHIEAVCDNLRDYLQANLPAMLDVVQAEGGPPCAGLSAPPANSYFIGEQSRFRGYEPPCLFIVASATSRTTDRPAGGEYDTLLRQNHRILIDILMEGVGVEELTRSCERMAQAIDSVLLDCDVTPAGITNRSTKVKIPKIDYGQIFKNAEGIFRNDIWVELLVMHWDQLTPLPIQLNTGGAGTVTIGQVGVNTTIAASISESLLTTTAATAVLSYTTGTLGGNYTLSIYYRATAPTTLTLTLTYQDGTGDQSIVPVNGSIAAESVSVEPLFFNCNGGQPITLTATAGSANLVYVSATLEKLS